MFAYPKQSAVNRVLPKTKIYTHAKASNALQRKFVDQVDKILWRYKLATETTNLTARHNINEIQVFEIYLKADDLNEDILRAIDRTIRHPIAFQVKCPGKTRFVMTAKRKNEADTAKWVIGEYFWTDWQTDDEIDFTPLPTVLDLHALYEEILRRHFSLPAREGESLQDQLERVGEVLRLEREADKLESKINKEKQFNRKVELNRELRSLKTEAEGLKGAEA